MRIDQTRIDDLLRLVAEKKIDADSAARSLLGIDWTADCESMQSLVHRLGPPPPEVEEDWKHQIQSIARSWQARENRPLPPLTLADWFVDSENRVSLSPQVTTRDDVANPSLLIAQPASDPPPATSTPRHASPTSATRPKRRKHPRNRSQMVAAVIAVIALILLIVLANARPNKQTNSPLTSDQTNSPPRLSRPPSPFDPGFFVELQPAAEEAVDVQAGVMAIDNSQQPFDQPSTPPPIHPDFGFDNPLLSGFTADFPDLTAATNNSGENGSDPEQSPPSLPLDRSASGDADADWDAVAADIPEPDDITIDDQPVESATPHQAVTLPALRPGSPSDDFTLIGVNLISQVLWDFPTQTNIQLVLSQTEAENGSAEPSPQWHWIDATSGSELATLQQIDQQVLFRWSEQAISSPLARQMAAGRLRLTDSGDHTTTVLLRPHLRTSPLRLDATDADARFSWPLEGPAIYQSPSLNLEVTQPEMVDMSWVEPPDPTNIRKQIATLQWTPSGKPSPAIRCRIECKTSTKMQMRLRYFAQLDSTFPWQTYSATQLTMSLDQVTQLLERRTAELSQIENQYRNATTSEKRSIRLLKENVEQTVAQLRLGLQKLQQLNILHSTIAATSHLQLSLTTQWPDGPQTILEIPLPDK